MIYITKMRLVELTHITFPCDLDSSDKINIDLRADRPVDLLIMDGRDYENWDKTGELQKEYLDCDELRVVFTAEDPDKYLVVVRNNSHQTVGVTLKIRYVDE